MLCAVFALSERLWRLECRLNRPLASAWRSVPRTEFRLRAGNAVLSAAAGSPLPVTDLCIVLSTHQRVDPCLRLVAELARAWAEKPDLRPFVVVLEDRSAADYAPVYAALQAHFPERFAAYRADRWLGKRNYWQVYDRAFAASARLGTELVLFLQDDLSLKPRFFSQLLEAWHGIADPRKSVLYACAMNDDEPGGRWIRFARRSDRSGRVWQTQWFDLQAFLVGPRFFNVLRRQVFPVPEARWQRDPTCSSGVGEQFSRRLAPRSSIYQVRETLVFHGGETSLMNPEGRQRIRFDNRE